MCGNKSTYTKYLICHNCGEKVTFEIPKGTRWTEYCNNSVKCWNKVCCPNCGCNDFMEPINIERNQYREPWLDAKEIDSILRASEIISSNRYPMETLTTRMKV